MGGNGGSGGGGSGGHTLGIAWKGTAPNGDFTVARGMKGEAGLGGNGNFQNNGGQPGEALDTLEFPAP
jgi:hypothetical protein